MLLKLTIKISNNNDRSILQNFASGVTVSRQQNNMFTCGLAVGHRKAEKEKENQNLKELGDSQSG